MFVDEEAEMDAELEREDASRPKRRKVQEIIDVPDTETQNRKKSKGEEVLQKFALVKFKTDGKDRLFIGWYTYVLG